MRLLPFSTLKSCRTSCITWLIGSVIQSIIELGKLYQILSMPRTRAESRTCEEFESRLLEKYGLDDALRILKQDFMEWVESPGKGRNASVLLREFEERFARLSALDRTILDTSRVLLFVKSVDERDRDQVGSLLETEDGLTADWAAVKRVCGCFDKRWEWVDKGSTGAGRLSFTKV